MTDYNHDPIVPRVGVNADLAAATAYPNELLFTTDTLCFYIENGGEKIKIGGESLDTGFVNRTDSTLGMDGANFQVTTASSYVFYSAGKKYTKTTTQEVEITNDNTLHYVYFDNDGVLTVSTDVWSINSDKVLTAMVYKTGSAYAIFDERHAYDRNRRWHSWAHYTIGARYYSGFTGTFTDTTLSLTQGVIEDEDIVIDSGGTLTACRLWYRNTGAASMTFESNVTTPYKIVTGAIKYDNGGTLASVTNNYYVASYVYATNDQDYPIAVIVGQAQYANNTAGLNSCRAEATPTIPASINVEWKLLYQVIYQNASGTPDYIEANDRRSVSTGPAGAITVSSHAALVDRSLPNSHPQNAITDLTTADSPTFVTVKLSGLTDGYVPYHVADATGLANSPIYTDGTKIGIGTTAPASLTEIQGGLTTTGAVLTLGTKETTVVANDVLGRINFYAPLEADGSDAILPGASIVAYATATFDATHNSTALAFQTADSETAVGQTRLYIGPTGNMGFNTTNIEAWHSSYKVIELGSNNAIMYSFSGVYAAYIQNAYLTDAGIWYYKGSNYANAILQNSGTGIEFRMAASGTIDNAITWTYALTIGHTGGVHVGGTSDPGDNNLLVDGTITSTGEIYPTGGIAGEAENVSEDIRYGNEIFPGSLLPYADNTYNLGSATYRWANLYTADLHLKNDRGDYTIVEGEDDLYLRNNRTNKTYRFMLEEVPCG